MSVKNHWRYSDTNSHSTIKLPEEENHILLAKIEDGLGTLLMSRNVPHGQAVDSGRFSLSESRTSSRTEWRRIIARVIRPQRKQKNMVFLQIEY